MDVREKFLQFSIIAAQNSSVEELCATFSHGVYCRNSEMIDIILNEFIKRDLDFWVIYRQYIQT